MKDRLPKAVYKALQKTIRHAEKLDSTVADAVAVLDARAAASRLRERLNDFRDAAAAGDVTPASLAHIEARLTGHDMPLLFDVVILGVGMVPDTSLAEAAGLGVDRGIVVDRTQSNSNPAILAVGDPARVRHNGALLPRTEHWEAAQHDGQRAAATILGIAPPTDTAPWFWTDRHHRHVEAVGEMSAAEHIVLRGALGDSSFSAFGLAGGLVVGAVAVDEPTAVRAARRMIDRGIAVDSDRLADTSTDLRKLLRG